MDPIPTLVKGYAEMLDCDKSKKTTHNLKTGEEPSTHDVHPEDFALKRRLLSS
jgi:hypothetical protein